MKILGNLKGTFDDESKSFSHLLSSLSHNSFSLPNSHLIRWGEERKYDVGQRENNCFFSDLNEKMNRLAWIQPTHEDTNQ